MFDIGTGEKNVLNTVLSYNTKYAKLGDKILFNNEKNILQLLDINTNEIASVFKDGDISQPIECEHFVLTENKIYYIARATRTESMSLGMAMIRSLTGEGDMYALYCYDIERKQCEEICQMIDYRTYIHGLFHENGNLYLVTTNSTIGAGNNDVNVVEYSESTGVKLIFNDRMKEGRLSFSYPYVVYVTESGSFPVKLYNIKSGVSIQLATGCGESYSGSHYINRFSVVKQWCYYNKGREQMMYRIDLENPVAEIKVASDLNIKE